MLHLTAKLYWIILSENITIKKLKENKIVLTLLRQIDIGVEAGTFGDSTTWHDLMGLDSWEHGKLWKTNV